MRLTTYLILFFFLLILSKVAHTAGEGNYSSDCSIIHIDIGSGFSRDRTLICNAALKARAFFTSHGIEIQRQIRIRLHQDELQNHANHIGLYDADKDHIEMVTLEHARFHCNEKPPFDVQMDTELYESFVIHEVAHAIAEQNFNSTPASLIVHEYLAYVTQFSAMDIAAQRNILQQYNVSAFSGIGDMSLTYYQMDPNKFAVKAFRHFQSLRDKSRFIQELLSGAIKPNAPHVDWW